jgi:hypothetical protein
MPRELTGTIRIFLDPEPAPPAEPEAALESSESALTDAPASAPPTTARQPARPSPSRRQLGSMTGLLPWERAMLALANDTREAAFDGVAILIGPILPPGLMGSFRETIVRTAVQHGHAVTIDKSIWFPRPLDTSTPADVARLVHESVHTLDYATAGTEAFLKTYAMHAAVVGFSHDRIPHEHRASRVEAAAQRLLARFPQLTGLIASCDNGAIVAELRRGRDVYRAAISELSEGAAAAGGEAAAEAVPEIDLSLRHPLLELAPPAAEEAEDDHSTEAMPSPDLEDEPSRGVTVELGALPPHPLAEEEGATQTRRPWIELATPAMEARARAMDALEKLRNDELRRRREEAAAKAVDAPGDAQKAALATLEDIEAVAQARGIKPREERYSRYGTGATYRRLNLRARIEEGVRRLGSYEKAIEEIRHVDKTDVTAADLEFFRADADAFRNRFKAGARDTAMGMLSGSITAIREIVQSYGLPWDMTKVAAGDVSRGGKLAREVAEVVQLAGQSEHINDPRFVKKRVALATRARRLRELQQSVAGKAAASERFFEQYRRARDKASFERSHGEAARAADKELAAARAELQAAWAEAERFHPVLTSLRRGADIETVSLDKLATKDRPDEWMAAVLMELVPKLRDSALAAKKIRDRQLDPLTLPPVVSLTRATMFIPKGSLRDGIINDAVSAAKDRADSTLLQIAAFALAVITLIPSAGASLAIPAGIAAVGFATYSATREWEQYTTHKTLANTHLDLARSLATEEPSLTGFALSLVGIGLEALPLVHAFNKARKLKALVTRGQEATADARRLVDELNQLGHTRDGVPLGDRALADIHGAPGASAKGAGTTATHPTTTRPPGSQHPPSTRPPASEPPHSKPPGSPHEAPDVPKKPIKPPATEPEPPKKPLKPPPRDPELPHDAQTLTYTSSQELKKDIAGALRKLRHGTAVPNPDMNWVRGILSRSAPDTSTNWQLLKVIDPYYATVRNPDAAAEFAAYLHRIAAEKRITARRALEEFTSGAVTPTQVRGSLERSHLLKDPPFVDLNFTTGDPHGRYTHMFMEGMIDYFHGPGAGRRLRHLIARATGPQGVRRRGKEFWETVWDAFFDDETGPHINRPEMLAPLLQKYLGLPL